MKKLIFGALVAAFAIGANAASMDWKVTIADADRQNKFMFFNASDRDAVVALLTDGGENIYNSVAAYAYADANKVAQFNTSSKSSTKNSRLEGISKGENVFMILFDTQTASTISDGLAYKATDDIDTTGWIYDAGAAVPEPSPGNLTFTANFTSTGTVGGGDVPEPTSAMLLLLGVAGLALRRRV